MQKKRGENIVVVNVSLGVCVSGKGDLCLMQPP